jgi:cysteine sulfinate desulfinase/cysteine desulfurase-like protein
VTRHYLDHASTSPLRPESAAAAAAAMDGIESHVHPVERLPHLACAIITDIEPQAVLVGLDRIGVTAHSGSACASDLAVALDALPTILADLRFLR